MKISVIIPTVNEEEYIEKCLESFSNQKFDNFDIIVVDGNSKDRTRKIARRYGKVFIQDGNGVSNARNFGAKLTDSDILVFSDADVIVKPDFLSIVNKKFQEGLGGAVPRVIPYDARSGLIRIGYKIVEKAIHTSIRLGFGASIGSCFAYRRDVFESVSGFDENLITDEDTDLALRTSKISKFGILPTTVFISARRANKAPFKYAYRSLMAFLMFSIKRKSYPPYWYDF